MRILIRPRTPSSKAPAGDPIVINPSLVTIRQRPLRVLDFDCECRPLSFLGSDFMTKEITSIAWAWTDRPENVTCVLLGEMSGPDIVRAFVDAYNQADIVTGHYIRGFDLPLINGSLMEYSLPVLSDKMAHDTKINLVRSHGISLSQESLGAMLRLEQKKVQMNQGRWREANRLTPEGLALTRERVVGDVRQHIELRRELDRLGYLRPPAIWKSGSAATVEYVP